MKVIGHFVYNDCLAYYLPGREAVGDKGKFCGAAFIRVQRRQITCVTGVRAVLGIKMFFCVGKGILCCACAASALVNVHCEDMAAAFFTLGQTVDRDCHKRFFRVGDKCGIAVYIGIFIAAVNNGFCINCIYKKHLPYSILYAVWEDFALLIMLML